MADRYTKIYDIMYLRKMIGRGILLTEVERVDGRACYIYTKERRIPPSGYEDGPGDSTETPSSTRVYMRSHGRSKREKKEAKCRLFVGTERQVASMMKIDNTKEMRLLK